MPTSYPPTSIPPSTIPPEDRPEIRCARMWKRRTQEVVVRAWTVDENGRTNEVALDPSLCLCVLVAEKEETRSCQGEADPMGTWAVRFALPQVTARPGHAYVLRVNLVRDDGVDLGTRDFFFGTT